MKHFLEKQMGKKVAAPSKKRCIELTNAQVGNYLVVKYRGEQTFSKRLLSGYEI